MASLTEKASEKGLEKVQQAAQQTAQQDNDPAIATIEQVQSVEEEYKAQNVEEENKAQTVPVLSDGSMDPRNVFGVHHGETYIVRDANEQEVRLSPPSYFSKLKAKRDESAKFRFFFEPHTDEFYMQNKRYGKHYNKVVKTRYFTHNVVLHDDEKKRFALLPIEGTPMTFYIVAMEGKRMGGFLSRKGSKGIKIVTPEEEPTQWQFVHQAGVF